ncbi:MAG: DivIVA domain-containing protein [Bdellovibrionales bacterium]|jgi:cell division initiation protein|nr:DivIVA domain-containing protein [Bdellovibrionales bacterium]MBL7670065.1 DivIVA domain-containing protein [Pseudobdellovibrionaceae bacterium]
MKLTPIDITHRTFGRKVMGLDADQVMAFLNEVAGQMEGLIHEKNHMKEALREKELSLLEYKERDKVLKDTITTATQMAERMRTDADREARLIIADAQQKAEIITRDSRDSLKKLYQEMTELKKMRIQFEANLKALAQAHMALLEQGEKYMPQLHLPNMTMTENQR